MALPRLQVSLLLDTPAHAATVRGAIEAEATKHPRFEDRFEGSSVEADPEGRGTLVRFDVRLLARGDRDAFRDWLIGQVRDHPTVKTWILGAKITAHLCTHDDESPGPCSESELQVVFTRGLEVNG